MISSTRLAQALILLTALSFALAPHARKKRERVKGPAVCEAFSEAVVQKTLGEGMTESSSRYVPLCSWSRPVPNADALNEAFTKEMLAWSTAKVRAMQTRTEAPPQPKAPVTTESVSVSWRGDAASAKEALAQLASARRTITEGITVTATGSAKKGFKTKTKIGDRAVDAADEKEAEAEANAVAKDALKDAPRNAPVNRAMEQEQTLTQTYQADVVDVEGVGDGAFWNPKHRALTVVSGKRMFTVTVTVPGRDARALAIELARGWL